MEYGPPGEQINGISIGIFLASAVQEASGLIRGCTTTSAIPKPNYAGQPDAAIICVADSAAQTHYLRFRQLYMPWTGVIAKQFGVRVPCTIGGEEPFATYLTVNGLAGSLPYVRGVRKGIGTMLSFVYDGEVAGAAVADVFGGQWYTLSPWKREVRWWRSAIDSELLGGLQRVPLGRGQVLLCGDIGECHPLAAEVIQHWPATHRLTAGDVPIGLSMARLWRDEVGMVVCGPAYETPWDDTPAIGIGKALDMVWLKPGSSNRLLDEYDPVLPMEVRYRKSTSIVVHRSQLGHLRKHVAVRELRQR